MEDGYGDIACIHCGWSYIEVVPVRAILERYKGRGSNHNKRDSDGRFR